MINRTDEKEDGEQKVCRRWTASKKCWAAMLKGACPCIGGVCQTKGAKRKARFGSFYPGAHFKLISKEESLTTKPK